MNEKELTNDEILSQISAKHEEIKILKAKMKPTPPIEEIPLHVLNAGAVAARMRKFAEKAKIQNAVSMAISRASEKPKSKKDVTQKPSS